MRFNPAVCAASVFLFIGSVLTLAGQTAFRPYGILGGRPTSEQLASTNRLNAILMDGWKLTPEKAAQLERKLAQNPENVAVRLLLISYYCQYTLQERRVRHVLELIESHPDADAFQALDTITRISPGDPTSNRPEDYVRAKALWQQQVSRFPLDTKVLSNAAMALSYGDPELALQWIKAARSADAGNGEWTTWLAKIYADTIRWSFWDGKSTMTFTGDAEDFRHDPFALPSSMHDAIKKELETSTDAALIKAVGDALVREVRLLREKSGGSAAKPFSFITPELQQLAEFGESLRGRARTMVTN
jgi:hypothetical protein